MGKLDRGCWLAHVVVSKFADHLPLYRQSGIYAREGVDLSRSTLADWLGQVSWLLQPLVDRIVDHVMASPKLHADDTPVPVLTPGTGKTATSDYGSICATTDDGAQATGQRHCSVIARIAKASVRASISRHSRYFCKPMPMPGSNGSMPPTVSRA